MDKEKLFAELCASAPPMPNNWAPPGKTRLSSSLGGDAARQLYEQRTGNNASDLGDSAMDRGMALRRWYSGLLNAQDTEYSPAWRVQYAMSVLAAMEGV